MRSQALLFLLISLFSVELAFSQSDELIIQGQTGKFYVVHTVAAKENWYSVGRMYNVSPKLIAPFNHTTMTQPLTIGQQLQIPLSAANFSQNGQKAAAETLVPLYHVVQEKEWMYRVSVNYNKVPIPTLEKWNHINKDQVKAGMHLVVGYLKVNTAQSALAATAGRQPAAVAAANAAEPLKPLGERTGPVKSEATERAKADRLLAEKEAAAQASGGEKTVIEKAAEDKAAVDKAMADKAAADKVAAEKAGTDKGAGRFGNDQAATDKANADRIAAEKAAADKAAADKAAQTARETKTTPLPVSPVNPTLNFNGGFFKVDFVASGKSAGGQGGVFKSTSGWQDGKYYALMNGVAVGTIVKVTASGSGRTIYAKVLGQLPDMKESSGLTIRVSNAAAAELGQGDVKFTVDLNY